MKRAEGVAAPPIDPATVPRALRVPLLDVWGSRRRYKDVCAAWRASTGAGFNVLPERGVWRLDGVDIDLAGRRLAQVGVTEDDVDDLYTEARALAGELLDKNWTDFSA